MNIYQKGKRSLFLVHLSLLICLWCISFFLPNDIEALGIGVAHLFKILAIVASLEMMGHVSYHFAGERFSIMLQGFFGGFVSSTAVFLKFSHDEKYSRLHPRCTLSGNNCDVN